MFSSLWLSIPVVLALVACQVRGGDVQLVPTGLASPPSTNTTLLAATTLLSAPTSTAAQPPAQTLRKRKPSEWTRHAHSWAAHKVAHHHHAAHSAMHKSTYHGRGTWYSTGQGACGGTNADSEHVVAISHTQYVRAGAGAAQTSCYRAVLVTNAENGKSARATIVDMCPGCAHGSLDMSMGLFKALSEDGGLGEGVLTIKWAFED